MEQMEELLLTGILQYPLVCANEIKEIKYGKKTWKEIEKLINDGIENIDNLQNTVVSNHYLDKEFVRNFILNCY